jgi:hypothetical protein
MFVGAAHICKALLQNNFQDKKKVLHVWRIVFFPHSLLLKRNNNIKANEQII